MTQEFHAFLQLLAMLVMDPRTGALISLLILAAVIDCRSYRIPNWLTASGTLFGLLYNAVAPLSPHTGLVWAFEGLALGLLAMLPLYALRVMGAGDVKLMAMTGAFLGVPDTLYAVVSTFIVGGMLALGFAVTKRALVPMLNNVRNVVNAVMISAIGGLMPDVRMAHGQSVGKMPYGVSICIGTIVYVVVKQLGYV